MTSEKIAELTPIAMASVAIATAVNMGVLVRLRKAKRRSCMGKAASGEGLEAKGSVGAVNGCGAADSDGRYRLLAGHSARRATTGSVRAGAVGRQPAGEKGDGGEREEIRR